MLAIESRIPLELLFRIIQFVSLNGLWVLLSVSSQVRREAQGLLYRDIELTDRPQTIKFASIVPHVGNYVRSLTVIEAPTSVKKYLQKILTYVPLLEALQVGKFKAAAPPAHFGFLPTSRTILGLNSFITYEEDPTAMDTLIIFLHMQRDCLFQLELPLIKKFTAPILSFTQLRILSLYNTLDHIWDLLQQGRVLCVQGTISSSPYDIVFHSIRAIQDFYEK